MGEESEMGKAEIRDQRSDKQKNKKAKRKENETAKFAKKGK